MDPRRKRLLFRARHMGTAENDLLFGRFAEARLAGLTEEQVARFRDPAGGRRPGPQRLDYRRAPGAGGTGS